MRLRSYWVYSLILMLFCANNLIAQPANDSIVFLKLKKKKTNVSILPDTNVLLRWQTTNEFYIQSQNPDVPVSFVRGVNMEVKDLGGGKYRLLPYYSDTLNYDGGKLLIYCLDAKGISRLNTIKEYKFAYPEMPIITIANIHSDSVILAKQLVSNNIKATHEGNVVKVLSYSILYNDNGEEKELTEYTSILTLRVRNIFRKLLPGDIIRFKNIKVLLRNGYIETIPLLTYYIDEESSPTISTRQNNEIERR